MEIKTKEFIIRVAAISAAALIILFFINLWIVKPLASHSKGDKAARFRQTGGCDNRDGAIL